MGAKVIASESLSAIRKDVLAKCYGKTSGKPMVLIVNFLFSPMFLKDLLSLWFFSIINKKFLLPMQIYDLYLFCVISIFLTLFRLLIAWVASSHFFLFDVIFLGGDITRKKKLLRKQVQSSINWRMSYFNSLFYSEIDFYW